MGHIDPEDSADSRNPVEHGQHWAIGLLQVRKDDGIDKETAVGCARLRRRYKSSISD